jgi:hypothetical protein
MSDKTPNVLARFHFYAPSDRKRAFYASKESGDYLRYVDTGSVKGKYLDYMDYSGTREKSSGAFSRNGLMTAEEKAETRKKLRSTESVVWDVVISFEEDYGKKKMQSWRNAFDLVTNEFPKFLRDNHMPYDNVEWFAGLHENTDNRHIHLSFFEKEPVLKDPDTGKTHFHTGYLSKLSLESFKVRIEERLNGKEYALHSHRDRILEQEEKKLSDLDQGIEKDQTTKEMLLDLYRSMPKGNYGYSNHKADEIRPKIDRLTSYLISTDQEALTEFIALTRKLNEKDEEILGICARDKIDPEPYLLTDRFRKDLYRRCGDRILAYLRESSAQSIHSMRGGNEEQKKRWAEKAKRSWLFSKTARLNEEVGSERRCVFDEFEQALKKAEWSRLIESGEAVSE